MRLIVCLGGTYSEYLDRNASVHVHGSDKAKLEKPLYAMDRQIPVVTGAWLLQSIAAGRKQPLHSYKLSTAALDAIGTMRQERDASVAKKVEVPDVAKR